MAHSKKKMAPKSEAEIKAQQQAELDANRRGYSRFPIDLIVTYERMSKPGKTYLVISADIGAGGLRCELMEELNEGEPIRLMITLPNDAGILEAEGVVRYVKGNIDHGFHTGFQFTRLIRMDSDNLNYIMEEIFRESELHDTAI